MRMNTCGCDVGFGCISEKHTICTCHWVDNPEICGIKVNLSLKMKWIQNISRHDISRSACLWFCQCSTFCWRAKVIMTYVRVQTFSPYGYFLPSFWHSISSFTFLSQPFFCMIERTFVRIIYHYMGLPFLCMLGSLRITGRLLHIFKTSVPDLTLSFPSGSFW